MGYDVFTDGGETGELAYAGSEILGGFQNFITLGFGILLDVFRVF